MLRQIADGKPGAPEREQPARQQGTGQGSQEQEKTSSYLSICCIYSTKVLQGTFFIFTENTKLHQFLQQRNSAKEQSDQTFQKFRE